MANQKTLAEQFYATRDTDFDDSFWNRFLGELTAKFKNLEAIEISWDALTEDALEVALERINAVLGPASQRIQNIAALGFLSVDSKSSRTLSIGTVSFTAEAGDQLDLFVPTPFVAVTRASNAFDFAIGRVIYFNRADRIIDIDISYFEGDPGPHNDWTIAAVAGQALAQASILGQTTLLREETVSAKNAAVTAKGQSEAARDITVAVASVYHGARNTPPPVALLGHQYLDTSATPNVVKVLTASGWAPTVTVSIGGVREVDYPAATGTEGVGPFAVGGGFTRGDVYINGIKLRNGSDVTLAPGLSGSFTLAESLMVGDEMSFRGYLANDAIDIYTKSEVDGIASTLSSDISTRALKSTTISGGGLATGGGDLSASRTLTVPKSTSAQALAGTDDTTAMTPLRTKEAIAASSPVLFNGGYNVVSLALGTAKQNNTGKAIAVSAIHSSGGAAQSAVSINVGPSSGALIELSRGRGDIGQANVVTTAFAIVGPGQYYSVTALNTGSYTVRELT